MKEFIAKLSRIQCKLNAPKNQFNSFGKYNYRSCEDILEALKPLLLEEGLNVTITDDIHVALDRIYVKATVTITDGEHTQQTTALAREALTKKGMDDSQITGTASSYARKYALSGLFLIDDNKDADSMNNSQPQQQNQRQQPQQQQRQPARQQQREPVINPQQMQRLNGAMMVANVTEAQICKKYQIKRLGELPASMFDTVHTALEKQAIHNQKAQSNTQAA